MPYSPLEGESCERIREGEPPGEPPCRKHLTQRGSAGASPSHVNGFRVGSHLRGVGDVLSERIDLVRTARHSSLITCHCLYDPLATG
jgi:hypothetical protein